MGVAALVLGIISLLIGFIPVVGAIAFIPALIGLVLGIVEIVKKSKANQPKAMGIAGTVLSAIAIVIIIFWVFIVGTATYEIVNNPEDFMEALNEEYDRWEEEWLESGYGEL